MNKKPYNHKASQSSPDSIRMQSKYEDGLWRFWARKLLIEVKEMEFSIQIVLFAAGLIGSVLIFLRKIKGSVFECLNFFFFFFKC